MMIGSNFARMLCLVGLLSSGSAGVAQTPETPLAIREVNRPNLAWKHDWPTVLKEIKSAGFDSVRMVAIDDDWSALRFRRNEFIKSCPREDKGHSC